jgi:hypothetical protein
MPRRCTAARGSSAPPPRRQTETYREDGKVKNRTLANLTKWKPEKIADGPTSRKTAERVGFGAAARLTRSHVI